VKSRSLRYTLLSLPIWFKVLVGLVVVALVPLALLFAAMRPVLRDLSLQNLRLYVSENGERQQQAISSVFGQARANLDLFTADETTIRRLTNFLLRDTPPLRNSTVRVEPDQIRDLFNTVLLNPSTTLFDSVRLLDRNGRLVVAAALDDSRANVTGEDQSRSAAYRTAQNAQLNQDRPAQTMTVASMNGEPVIEFTHVLLWRDGKPLGYLIAELNIPRTLYGALVSSEASYPVYSFLLAGQELFISRDDTRDKALAALHSPATERAMTGETGVDVYTLSSSGTEVLGSYAPLLGTPLALIIEAPTSSAALQAQTYFASRLVLAGLVGLALAFLGAFAYHHLLAVPVQRLRQALQAIRAGQFDAAKAVMDRADEIGLLGGEIDSAQGRIVQLLAELRTRIATQTRDIAATQEISRYAVSQRDVRALLESVVELIVSRFPDIYHAQIYLLDTDRRVAILRASTGEPGRKLLEHGHRLAVSSASVVGLVTAQGRVVSVDDLAASPVHQRNEFLPETRSELGIPLRIGDDVIGALDVQSRQPSAFSDDLVSVLRTMADQIAVAIQNARLYEESVRRLTEIEQNNRRATQAAWQDYMRARRAPMLTSSAGHLPATPVSLRATALETRQIAVGPATARNTIPVAVPVLLRGHVLGVVEWELAGGAVDENRLQLAQDLANRLAVSLENARLFEESQRATERERIVNSITARLTAQTDVDEILQTAVREVGRALHAPQVTIRLEGAAEGEKGGQRS
jgi:GAF domain-containing protein